MREITSSVSKRFLSSILILLFVCSLILNGCRSDETDRIETDGIHSIYLFYTNASATTLQDELIYLPEDSTLEDKVSFLLEAAINPPQNYASIIPDGFEIAFELVPDENSSDEKYHLYFHVVSGDYDSLSPNRANVFRVGLIKSMFRLKGISSISLYKGRTIDTGNRISYVTSTDNVIVNENDENFFKDTIAVKLYFIDDKGDHLTSETRNVNVAISESVAEKIVEQLIAGPEDPAHKSAIPDESAVNDVMIRNNICYVDMNEAFVRNHVGGELAETLTIYSIVNSMTQLYGVDSVQILINGQQKEYYKGYVKINIPLSYNGELVSDSKN